MPDLPAAPSLSRILMAGLLAPLFIASACDPAPSEDAGVRDAGADAAGRTDAGPDDRDAGPMDDAGGSMDAGPPRPPMPTPTCQVGSCENGFARTCGDDPQALLCSDIGADCANQVDFETNLPFTWCDCGDIVEGDGRCIGGPIGVVCSAGLGGLSDCGVGYLCEERPGSPFGIGCACDDLPDDICPSGCASDPDCATCTPDCSGRSCGDNGCGGSCGQCGFSDECVSGSCVEVCVPNCDGRECGDDGCGGSCGGCGTGRRCEGSSCVDICVPSCAGRECGSNGCGGLCGACGSGETCDTGSGRCETVCTPSCGGLACGDDGCGGSCGDCPSGDSCTVAGQCMPNCTPACDGRACGDDGCGGACGACGVEEVCTDTGACEAQCVPNCTGRECGDDGCGGTCGGACAAPLECWTGPGRCVCDFSAFNDYTFDATALSFTQPAPNLSAGDLVGVHFTVVQAPASSLDVEITRTAYANRSTTTASVAVSGCVPSVSIRTRYFVVDAAEVSYFECSVTQAFDGTDFVVSAPTVDLSAGSCVAVGLTQN